MMRLSGMRLLRPTTTRCLLAKANTLMTSSNLQRHQSLIRWPFNRDHNSDDHLFGMASNLMRNLEREFDYARRQLEKGFTGLNLSQQKTLSAPSSSHKSTGEPKSSSSLVAQDAFDEFVITDEATGARRFQMSFDLRGFEPEEIKVRTQGNYLTVSAKKEQASSDEYYLREFSQSFSLPKDLRVQDLKTHWTDECCLMIEAELPKLTASDRLTKKMEPKRIPIEHVGNDDSQQPNKKAINDGTKQQQDPLNLKMKETSETAAAAAAKSDKQVRDSLKKQKENDTAQSANLTS